MAKIDPRLTQAIGQAKDGASLQAVFTLRSDEPDTPLAPAQTEARVKAAVEAASAKASQSPNRVVVFPNLQSFSIDADAQVIKNLLDADHIETATLNKAS